MTNPQPPARSPRPLRPKAASESGYAMLLVFLIAAMIAIMLYRELPRVAFESQRAKEQLLIERGEQYKRAIQLFVRKLSRYPATIEELESTNNMRFLRKRYIDPMTGKDKWRLIHINGGVLTDSAIQNNKPGQTQQPQANTNTFIGEGPVMGATNDPNQQQNNPALRRRASDDRPVVTQEAPSQPQQPDADQEPADTDNNNGETPAPNTPGTAANGLLPGVVPNQPGVPQGRFPQPGMYPPGTYPNQPGTYPNQPGVMNPATGQPYGIQNGGMPNQISSGGFATSNSTDPNASGASSSSVYVAPSIGSAPTPTPVQSPFPGRPGFPGQPGFAGGQPGFPGGQPSFPQQTAGGFGQPNAGFGQQAGGFGQTTGGFGQSAGGFGQSAAPAGQAAGGGVDMSTLGLNGPRPGGLQGVPGMGGTQVGGGIAGVASESQGPAIIVYNERKKYNEWEFVYDQTKDRGLAGVQRGGGAPGTPAGQMGSMPNGMNPQQPGGMGGPGGNTVSNGIFGPSGGFGGQSSGFGQSGPQQPQPQQPQQPQN